MNLEIYIQKKYLSKRKVKSIFLTHANAERVQQEIYTTENVTENSGIGKMRLNRNLDLYRERKIIHNV